nr:hypothetical protein P5621_04740 [Bacillus subtilis]
MKSLWLQQSRCHFLHQTSYHYLVLTKALEREKNYVSWLESILAMIDKD